MGQKNNANGFRKTGLDLQSVANYKALFQKRYQTEQYLKGAYRNYTLGNISETDQKTWIVEFSKEPKKTPVINKEKLESLCNVKVVEKVIHEHENATVIANGLKKEFSVNLKKTLQKNALPEKNCHLVSKGRHNGAEMANQEEYGIRLPLQTIKAPIEYAYSTALTKYGLISLKVTARPRNKNKNETK
jgi:ribosomal protein S3